MGQTAALKASAAVAIAVAAFPTGASAMGSRSVTPDVGHHGHQLLVREPVSSKGIFEVSVDVSAPDAANVRLQIGKIGRLARMFGSRRHATVRVRMPISGHTLTIRASATSAPTIAVTLLRIGARTKPVPTPVTGWPNFNSPSASTKSGGASKGATGSAGAVAPAPAAPTGAGAKTGTTGTSGSAGTTGSGTGAGTGTGSGSSVVVPLAPVVVPVAPVLAPVVLVAQALAAGPLGVAGAWHPIFDDEFNAPSLNASVWNTGWLSSGLTGPMNTEEEECYSPSQVSETGGELDLTAAATAQTGCPMFGGPSTVNEPYVSGMINTKDKFSYTYGYLETRVWLPGTPSGGTDWPAVWAVGSPAPQNGEIDVIEGLSGLASWHFHDPSGAGFGSALGGYAGAWHTFGADWEPGSITFYYDGIKVGVETANITSAPMYLIANLAVDTTYGGPATPAAMKIDYIRIFQH
jgi:hypothetical protein